jgi:hypothetical protein
MDRDKGWVCDDAGNWELRGQGFELLADADSAFILRVGVEAASGVYERRGLPKLTGRPAIVCWLWLGRQDGRWLYLDADDPPQTLALPAPVPSAMAGIQPRPDVDTYQLDGQACGHGNRCPYKYRPAS